MLSHFPRVSMAVSFLKLVRRPTDTSAAFAMADAGITIARRDPGIMAPVVAHLMANPDLRAAYEKGLSPVLPDIEALRAMPDGSVGRTLATFFDAHGFDPAFYHLQPADDIMGFMDNVMRANHDLWHVVTGYAPDIAGELELQAFTLAQTGGALSLVFLAAGFLKFAEAEPLAADALLGRVVEAYRRGKASQPLITVPWHERLAEPLEAVRAQLGLAAA